MSSGLGEPRRGGRDTDRATDARSVVVKGVRRPFERGGRRAPVENHHARLRPERPHGNNEIPQAPLGAFCSPRTTGALRLLFASNSVGVTVFAQRDVDVVLGKY
jgi:hypothetical protein